MNKKENQSFVVFILDSTKVLGKNIRCCEAGIDSYHYETIEKTQNLTTSDCGANLNILELKTIQLF